MEMEGKGKKKRRERKQIKRWEVVGRKKSKMESKIVGEYGEGKATCKGRSKENQRQGNEGKGKGEKGRGRRGDGKSRGEERRHYEAELAFCSVVLK